MHVRLGRPLSFTLGGKRKWGGMRSPVFNVSHTDESQDGKSQSGKSISGTVQLFHSHTMILQSGQTVTGTATFWTQIAVLVFYLVAVAPSSLYDK